MTAQEKTNQLLRFSAFPLDLIDKNEENPNRMTARAFDLLCDNMGRTGWTDPALARPLDLPAVADLVKKHGKMPGLIPAKMKAAGLRVKIVGGHHRYDAAKYLGFEAGPVTLIMDPNFDEDAERFQMVRMNVIHGKLDPKAFFDLYQKLTPSYTDEVMQEAFGFADEAEFQRLINQTAKAIPDPVLKKKFKDAAKELKTIDGLSKLLNSLFTKYGDTLPYGFMVFDHAGQRSVWLQVENKTLAAMDVIGEVCIERKRTVDDVVGGVLQLIAKGALKEVVDSIVETTSEVELPDELQTMPTKENLQNLEAVG